MSQEPERGVDEVIKFLVELVKDDDADLDLERRIQSAQMVANLGDAAAAVSALVELGGYTSMDGWDRLQIARGITKLGHLEDAVEMFVAICEDGDLEWEERNEAAQEILRMGDTVAGVAGISAVLHVANEFGVDMGFDEVEYRNSAAERLAKAGETADAIEVLKVVTEDDSDWGTNKYDAEQRWNAASTLAEIGGVADAAKAFMSLAVDDYADAEDHDRLTAALELIALD